MTRELREMTLDLPAEAAETKVLPDRVNGLIREGYPEQEIIAAATRGLIEIVARLEAATNGR